MLKNFAILGAGAWGTTIALVLSEKPHQRVSLWSARAESAEELRLRRENTDLLPGVSIPDSIHLTASLEEGLRDVDLVIVAIPTIYLRGILQKNAGIIPANCPALSLVKGMERNTFLRPTQILQELIGSADVAVLSGPSHAEEVSRGMPTSVVVASEDLQLARAIQESLNTDRFRVYTNLDVVGVELGGALKNIIGIAAGVCDGLRLGDNAKAALLTRGLVEMTRFGVALGAEPQTFQGLAGMGDLITTCFSPHGRNRRVGERLARGESLQTILNGMKMIAEGVYTTESVYQKATQMGISMPITCAIYDILYKGKSPQEAVNELMVRSPKSEAGGK